MDVTVVIPWRGTCPYRQAALEWVLARYRERHPEWAVKLVTLASWAPWVKAKPVMGGVHETDSEIVVVADADVWCDGLPEAVAAVERGIAWAVPHQRIHRLTKSETGRVLAGAEPDLQALCEPPYVGLVGGGIVVARREALLEVPPDPRFKGWGEEDRSWGRALRCLLGKPWRGKADLVHLWHPPQERMDRMKGSEPGLALQKRYAEARENPAAMRTLIEEIGGRHARKTGLVA